MSEKTASAVFNFNNLMRKMKSPGNHSYQRLTWRAFTLKVLACWCYALAEGDLRTVAALTARLNGLQNDIR
jgi:hypothetical protein